MNDDLISRQKSRQKAIDAITKYDFNFPEYMERFVTELRDAMKADLIDDIKSLLAVQPEIIRCKDCTYWHDSGKCDCFSISERNIEVHMDKDGFCSEAERGEEEGELMNDPISRRQAIEAVIDADYKDCGVLVERRCRKFEEALRSLPAAQPDNDMIHLQKEQAYMQGWEDGREALRKEMWDDGRDRLD